MMALVVAVLGGCYGHWYSGELPSGWRGAQARVMKPGKKEINIAKV